MIYALRVIQGDYANNAIFIIIIKKDISQVLLNLNVGIVRILNIIY
jgi:hypothetical protein